MTILFLAASVFAPIYFSPDHVRSFAVFVPAGSNLSSPSWRTKNFSSRLMKVWHDNVVSVFSENIINGCAKMIKPHLTYPIGSSWHIRPPQSASTYLGSLQRSALPLTIAVLLPPFPFQPFASRWVFFVFLFFFFLLLPQSSGCFGGIPVAYSAQWRPVGLSPVHHRVSFVLRNSYSVPLIKWIFFASGVCNNRLLPERVTSPQPNPELGGPGDHT